MNVYQIVTSRIIDQLEKGTIPWKQPWMRIGGQVGAYNRVTKKSYSILNQMLLMEKGAGEYATKKQWQSLGGQIKEEENPYIVVFWKLQKFEEETEEGETLERTVPLLRYYRVYHISQIDGVAPLPVKEIPEKEGIKAGDELIKDYVIREGIRFDDEGSDRAFYSLTTDSIVVPNIGQYNIAEEYYSTTFHEMAHSTGHPNRLGRNLTHPFGSDRYAREELIAEIASCMLMNQIDMEIPKTFENSVAYIDGWTRAMEEDPKLIVNAAIQAEKAVKYIMNDYSSIDA